MYNSRRITVGVVLFLALLALAFGARSMTVSAAPKDNPTSVTIPGSLDSEIGCPGDWQPDCAAAHLDYDSNDDVWQKTFNLPANSPTSDHYEYKAALNDSWDVNYGLHAGPNGANIPLPSLTAATPVKFYYDNKTHWVTDNVNSVIAVAPGSFQSELGCSSDWDPSCLRSWLEDPDGDGTYTFSTTALPAGNYEGKVALNESWDVNYGSGCAAGGGNIGFNVPFNNAEILFSYVSSTHCLTIGGAQKGNLSLAQAQWLSHDTIAWQVACNSAYDYRLHYDYYAALALGIEGVSGGQYMTLTCDSAGLGASLLAKFPNLSAYSALKLPAGITDDQVKQILRGEVAVSVHDNNGALVDATGVQIPGVLDDVYAAAYNSNAVGMTWNNGSPTLTVWAPTAQEVKLHLFADPTNTISTTVNMQFNSGTGLWTANGPPTWNGMYYLYEVKVFTHYSSPTNQIVTNMVSDPYSVGLSMNGTRSLIVNLADASTKPAGWDSLVKPALAAPEDITLYELHIRDFSISDTTVAATHRGGYLAFTDYDSNGMQHLKSLAEAGLTHIHILPSFDIASINEDKSTWQAPSLTLLASLAPTSTQQSTLVINDADKDGFNWGYDPVHYTTPDGSYATDPNGTARIVEFRDMVQGLSNTGLRTVMDVVYNHTSSSGENTNSVLDEIVPGYYYRLNADGAVENGSCCQDTATEHMMMDKLVVDSTVTWAKYYKVDGFRFDIMGFQPLANLEHIQTALRSLTLANDGVDGSKIYLYGEGWNFGSVMDDAKFVQARQANLAGTGIGSFNDRERDAARGGGPFNPATDQGFTNGLYYDPNGLTTCGSDNHVCTQDEAKALLLQETDWIKLSMAGNLKDYTMVDANGSTIRGSDLDYKGQKAGYTLDPSENIVYDEAHDGETLFDRNVFAAPISTTTTMDRVRMQNIGADVIALAQGIPFFHAGQDLMRSKSLDTNSYNSGDWFNRIDWTGQQNTFGSGVPPTAGGMAALDESRLALTASIKPSAEEMNLATKHFQEILSVRKSSRLFRLETATDIKEKVSYLNNGPSQIPGLIVQEIDNTKGAPISDPYDRVVSLINATTEPVTFTASEMVGMQLVLHPILAASVDPVVRTSAFDQTTGTFTVPARTTAVFVQLSGETTPGNCEKTFTDVPTSYWAFGYIRWVACNGIVSGYEDGSFHPEAATTRGQVTKMVVLAAGMPINITGGPHFSDVPADSVFYSYIETAYNAGLISGYNENGTMMFQPNEPVTRAQLTKIIVSGAHLPLVNPATPTFSDVPASYWAYQYIETAVQHNILGGYDIDGGLREFRPANNADRAQLSKLIFQAWAVPALQDSKASPSK